MPTRLADAMLSATEWFAFGDIAKLGLRKGASAAASRLRHERDPIGWFLHAVWDRALDRSAMGDS